MTSSRVASLDQLLIDFEQISSQNRSASDPEVDFQRVFQALTGWRDRAAKAVESEFSENEARKFLAAADFNVAGDLGTLAEEAGRYRTALEKLFLRAEMDRNRPLQEVRTSNSTLGSNQHTTVPNELHNRSGENGKSSENDSHAKFKKSENEGVPNGNKETRGDDLLLRLGKIAGIGGISVGTFLILLRKLVFPTLTVNLAALFMFLCYGIAVLGLIIWGYQATKNRVLPVILLLGALVLAFFGWSSLNPGQRIGPAYRVRVAVYSPDDSPVDDAHVESSIGGTTGKIPGGAEIALPSTAKKGQEVTVTAEVAKLGWEGAANLRLTDDFTPPLRVLLKGAAIRGTIFNERGTSVSNAQVSIIGFGEEAVSTGAHGQFVLPSHAHKGDKVHLHAELANLVADKEDYEVGTRPAELVLNVRGGAEDNASSLSGTPAKLQVHLTHDAVIDRVLINLATLKQSRRPPTEAQLMETLTPLFTRPAFYGMREEDWRYFLYPLCRTRLLLEEYVNQFKSKPEVRKNIAQAIDKMVALQNEVAQLYGPTFSITQHIDRYINDKDAFIDNLPPVLYDPKPEDFDHRDQEIWDVRNLLHAAGFQTERIITPLSSKVGNNADPVGKPRATEATVDAIPSSTEGNPPNSHAAYQLSHVQEPGLSGTQDTSALVRALRENRVSDAELRTKYIKCFGTQLARPEGAAQRLADALEHGNCGK